MMIFYIFEALCTKVEGIFHARKMSIIVVRSLTHAVTPTA